MLSSLAIWGRGAATPTVMPRSLARRFVPISNCPLDRER